MPRFCSRSRTQAVCRASVKLLRDENLSDKIIARISDLFPDCTHVKSVELMRADDATIADWANGHGFSIVSKDTDFYQRSVALGFAVKVYLATRWKLRNQRDCRCLAIAARPHSGLHAERNRACPRVGARSVKRKTASRFPEVTASGRLEKEKDQRRNARRLTEPWLQHHKLAGSGF